MQTLHLLAGPMRQGTEASAFRAGIELSLKFVVYNRLLGSSQGQAAIDAHQQNALEAALDHLGRMEAANLEVMRIVGADQHSVA